MHTKSLKFKSALMSIFGQDHYRLVMVPRGHPSAKSVLSYQQYKRLSMEERFTRNKNYFWQIVSGSIGAYVRILK